MAGKLAQPAALVPGLPPPLPLQSQAPPAAQGRAAAAQESPPNHAAPLERFLDAMVVLDDCAFFW